MTHEKMQFLICKITTLHFLYKQWNEHSIIFRKQGVFTSLFVMQIFLLYPTISFFFCLHVLSIVLMSKLSLVSWLKQFSKKITWGRGEQTDKSAWSKSIIYKPCSLLTGKCHNFPCSVHWIISSNILDGGCVTAKWSSRASRRCHVVSSDGTSDVSACDSGTLKIPRGSPPNISILSSYLKWQSMLNEHVTCEKDLSIDLSKRIWKGITY